MHSAEKIRPFSRKSRGTVTQIGTHKWLLQREEVKHWMCIIATEFSQQNLELPYAVSFGKVVGGHMHNLKVQLRLKTCRILNTWYDVKQL